MLVKCSVVAAVLVMAVPVHAEPLATAVGEIALTVSDARRSLAFFRDALGCAPVTGGERIVEGAYAHLEGVEGAKLRITRCQIGDERLAFLEFRADPKARPIPVDQRSNDAGFQHVAIVVRDIDAAYARLRAHHVDPVSVASPEKLPQWNHAAAGIRAYYFHDPDRHTLELIWFPPGKGDPRWQRPRTAAPLFLGIDHTAIGVSDTDASLAFYRDLLGLRVAGGSENYGVEQERLSGVPGAHVRITTLRAQSGPGIEFLQYLAPTTGRALPADFAARDLLHWQTTIRVADPSRAFAAAATHGAQPVSTGVVDLPASLPFGTSRAALVRDRDGHALLLGE